MTAEKTPGQVSWTARNMALAGPGDQPGDVLAELDGAWDCLDPEEREAEEAGAQAAIDAFLAGDSVSAESIREALAAHEAKPGPGLTPFDLADQAIGLFLEYRDQHGRDEPSARAAAALEVAEGAAVTGDDMPGSDQ